MTAARYLRQLLHHITVTGEPERYGEVADAWALENIEYSPVAGAVESAWETFLDEVDRIDGIPPARVPREASLLTRAWKEERRVV